MLLHQVKRFLPVLNTRDGVSKVYQVLRDRRAGTLKRIDHQQMTVSGPVHDENIMVMILKAMVMKLIHALNSKVDSPTANFPLF
jgi:hypothetical protein